MSNNIKEHEKNTVSSSHAESVSSILNSVENTPFALRGADTKTILYAFISVIAAVELTSALAFYGASLGVSLTVAFVICMLVASGFHYLLHSVLSITAHGIVFKKRSESKAMSTEVVANIWLSVALLLIASCTVFFGGKKGFTAYRGTEYETKNKAALPSPGENKTITPDMLTSKSGKISVYKIELLTGLEKAKAATKQAENTASTTEKDNYDKTTSTITDIVGASAFILECLLALLAFAIATAKKAAVMEEIARRDTSVTPENLTVNDRNGQKTVDNRKNSTVTVERYAPKTVSPTVNTVTVTPANDGKNDATSTIPLCDNGTTVTNVPPKRTVINGFGATVPTDNKYIGTCPNCQQDFEKKNQRKIYCSTNCKTQHWQNKNGVSLLGEPLKQ